MENPRQSDFTVFDVDTQIKYWNSVFSETDKSLERLIIN